ncbi:unnamed protein product, partial [Acanthoscelides obtectus]
RQNIPLRGHRGRRRLFTDDITNDEDVLHNEGNFRELIRFRVESRDNFLKKNLENSKAHATYIRSRIQNEIIECCGEEILDIVLSRVRQSQILAQTVKHFIKTNNLDSKLCMGIGTDTCNLMLGEQKGAVIELQKYLPNALKSPCANHALNLSTCICPSVKVDGSADTLKT